jgi:hypothetical protein
MTSQPLILHTFSPGRWLPLPRIAPGTALVLTYGEDDRRTFTRRPSRFQRRGACQADLVDLRPQRARGELRTPARGDVYHFVVTVEVTWRVVDAAAMVAAHLQHPRAIVLTMLAQRFRTQSRYYEGHGAEQLEERLNRLFVEPWDIGAGLHITRAHAWVAIDPRLVQRRLTDDVNQFDADQDQRLLSQRVEHLREVMNGHNDAVVLHLAQHPEDTRSVLQEIVGAHERDRSARLELLEKLVSEGFLLDADVAPLRARVVGISTDSTWSTPWSTGDLERTDAFHASAAEKGGVLLPLQGTGASDPNKANVRAESENGRRDTTPVDDS